MYLLLLYYRLFVWYLTQTLLLVTLGAIVFNEYSPEPNNIEKILGIDVVEIWVSGKFCFEKWDKTEIEKKPKSLLMQIQDFDSSSRDYTGFPKNGICSQIFHATFMSLLKYILLAKAVWTKFCLVFALYWENFRLYWLKWLFMQSRDVGKSWHQY